VTFIDAVLGTPLGYILYACYALVRNYGVAIILFTVITKIALFPLSMLSQHNAITMVRIKPELESIKRRYDGNSTLVLEEQRALYKRERYSMWKGILPMLIQVPIIFGLINVIYHPLRHMLHVPRQTIDLIIATAANATSTDPRTWGMSAQLHAIDIAKHSPQAFTNVIPPDLLARIQDVHLYFLGMNLAEVPSWTSPTIVYPLLSALTALALCLYQNRYYVLQKYAGPASRIGITVFLVLFSGYFALVLPCGFGLYWTMGNLLSIVVVWLCNVVENPWKTIDPKKIPVPPKKTAEQRKAAHAAATRHRAKERADLARYAAAPGKRLLVYSEGSGYWKYFARVVTYLLDETAVTIDYVTSDPDDRVVARADGRTDGRLRAYYVGGKKLIPFMMRLDVDMVVMTTPDLEKYHV